MGYEVEVLSRARSRYTAAVAEHRQAQRQLRQQVYAQHPQIQALDREIQSTMADVMSHAFRYGEDPREAIAQIREKNLSLQRQRNDLLAQAGYAPEQLDDRPMCVKCSDTGYVGERLCTCLEAYCMEEQRKELTSLLSQNASFDDFRLDCYPDGVNPATGLSPRAQMELIYEACVNYASHFNPQKPRNLLMSGEPGLGKTFLSACIAGVVVARGYSVVYDTAIHVFDCIDKEHFGRASEQELRLTQRIMECDLLILDDLGTEARGNLITPSLYNIINGRMTSEKPTIISTNLTMDALAQRYSPAIISRLEGAFDILSFAGQDIRKLKKNGAF